MDKFVFLHPSLYKKQEDSILINSFRADVLEIKYDETVNYLDYLNSIDITSFTQVGFFYHFPGYCSLPFFNNGLSIEEYDNNKYIHFSNEFLDIIKLLKNGKENFVVDLISCNLQDNLFKQEVQQIENELNITIRYSIDETGNRENDGNWVLESHNINIKNEYFTESINDWNNLLTNNIATDIKNGTYSDYIIYDSNNNTYKIVKDFVWRDVVGLNDTDNIELLTNEIFDGQNHTIDLSGIESWQGLFSVSSAVSDISNSPLIKNIGMLNGGLEKWCGFILRDSQKFFRLTSSYSTGHISRLGSGGITGHSAGANGGHCLITNCYSSGTSVTDIASQYTVGSGGICGRDAGAKGTCIIKNCYSTGNIGENSGGICGDSAGYGNNVYSNCTIENCYSIGIIGGFDSGGIVGKNASRRGINNAPACTIKNCYSRGNITGEQAGGIAGGQFGSNGGIGTIINSYSSGTVTGSNAGGIVGADDVNIIIKNCVYNSENFVVNERNVTVPSGSQNSNDIRDINDQLYQNWDSSVWKVGPAVDVDVYKDNTGVQSISLPVFNVTQETVADPEETLTSLLETDLNKDTTEIQQILTDLSSNASNIQNNGEDISLNTSTLFTGLTEITKKRELKRNIIDNIFQKAPSIENFVLEKQDIGIDYVSSTINKIKVFKPGNANKVDISNVETDTAIYANLNNIDDNISFIDNDTDISIVKTSLSPNEYTITGTVDNNSINETAQDGDVKIYGGKKYTFGSVTVENNTQTTVGDPYIITLHGYKYKLYNSGFFRMLQGYKNSGLIINSEIKKPGKKHKKRILNYCSNIFKQITKKTKKQLLEGTYYQTIFIQNEQQQIIIDFNKKQILSNDDNLSINNVKTKVKYFGYNIDCNRCIFYLKNTIHGNIRITIDFYDIPQIENGFSMNIENNENMKGLMAYPYYEKDMRIKNLFDLEHKNKTYKLEKKQNIVDKREKWLFINNNQSRSSVTMKNKI